MVDCQRSWPMIEHRTVTRDMQFDRDFCTAVARAADIFQPHKPPEVD